jgi:hypothetical protein
MVSWIKRKRIILNKIVITLQDADALGAKVVKDKLISSVCIEYGSSRRKVLEYIKDLINVGRIKETWDRDGTYITLNKIEKELDL